MLEILDSVVEDSRYNGAYLKFGDKFSDWDVARMESCCTLGSGVEMIYGYEWGEELSNSSCTLVAASIWHPGF